MRQATTVVTDPPSPAVPLLKFSGGKRQLLPEIRKHVPTSFNRYFEPFVGGGAVFFDLLPAVAQISDANAELVNMYEAVRDDVEAVIASLSEHAREHSEEHYYSVRTQRPTSQVAVAARMIYLNKTCFNGLYRVNRKGGFNVPFGRYDNPTICDADNLRACSKVLQGVAITWGDFESTLVGAQRPPRRHDFVYCDPPYAPVSSTSNFTSYTAGGFTWGDQDRLARCARRFKEAGVHVLLSNADLPNVRELYNGFEMRTVQARRNINSNGKKRGNVGELLIW
jgi:DNA adenine methylase